MSRAGDRCARRSCPSAPCRAARWHHRQAASERSRRPGEDAAALCDDHADAPGRPRPRRLGGRRGPAACRAAGLLRGAAALGGGLLVGGPRALLHPAAGGAGPARVVGLAEQRPGPARLPAGHARPHLVQRGLRQPRGADRRGRGQRLRRPLDDRPRLADERATRPRRRSTSAALTERVDGGAYTWQPQVVGALSSRSGASTSPGAAEPGDPAPSAGGLVVQATQQRRGRGRRFRYVLDGKRPTCSHRANLPGTSCGVEVRPALGSRDAWGTRRDRDVVPAGDRRAGPAGTLPRCCTSSAPTRPPDGGGLVGRVRRQVADGALEHPCARPGRGPRRGSGPTWSPATPTSGSSRSAPPRAGARRPTVDLVLAAARAQRRATWRRARCAAQRGAHRRVRGLRYPALAVRQAIEIVGHRRSTCNWFGGVAAA